MITLINELRETEKKEGIMAASYLMGFPWADNPDSSVAVYVVAENQELADAEALRLAEFIWSKKDEFCFQTEALHEKEAIDAAFESIGRGQYPLMKESSLSRTRWLTAAFMIPRPQRPAKARWVRRSP